MWKAFKMGLIFWGLQFLGVRGGYGMWRLPTTVPLQPTHVSITSDRKKMLFVALVAVVAALQALILNSSLHTLINACMTPLCTL